MNDFFSELKRRNVVRVAIAYAIVAWVVLQFIEIVSDIMNFPEILPQVVLVLLVAGLPIALILSWAYEVTPEGVKKTKEVDKSKSVTHGTGQKINRIIAAGFVLAIAFIVYDKMIAPDEVDVTQSAEASGILPQATGISIAVLPFSNMSGVVENEYFSDGISEEILNALVRVDGLSVASRTSAFGHKGSPLSIPEIAEALNVDFVLEGSVRRDQNDNVRITAQLIEAATDRHLWSDTYDRNLANIFAVQEEIAVAIAGELQVSLNLAPDQQLLATTSDATAYDLYLRGRALYRERGEGLREARALLEEAIERDPNFGPAWGMLSLVYGVYPSYFIEFETGFAQAEIYGRQSYAISKAIDLDPDSPESLFLEGVYEMYFTEDYAAGLNLMRQALERDPNNDVIMEDYAEAFSNLGYHDKALIIRRRMVELAPDNWLYNRQLSGTLITLGEFDEGLEVALKTMSLGPDYIAGYNNYIFSLLAAERFEEIAVFVEEQKASNPNWVEWAAPREGVLGLDDWIASGFPMQNAETGEYYVSELAGFVTLSEYLNSVRLRVYRMGIYGDLHWPELRHLLALPEVKDMIKESELLAYWRENGWPMLCRPVGDDDFECGDFS